MYIEGDSVEATPTGNQGIGSLPSVTPFDEDDDARGFNSAFNEDNKIKLKPEPEASPIPPPAPASEDYNKMLPVMMQVGGSKVSKALSGRQRMFSEGPKVGLVKDQSKDNTKMNIIDEMNDYEDDNENAMTYGHVVGQSSGNIQVDEFVLHGDDMDENGDDSEQNNTSELNMGNEASDTGIITRGFIS